MASDEIHADLALFGHQHIPFATVLDHAADISITLGVPTKTFNIAGIVSSYAIVPNPALRQTFFSWIQSHKLYEPTLFAPIAIIAAFRHGEMWRRDLLTYVERNVKWVETFCCEQIPDIRPLRPQASFLVWLDCQGLGLSHQKLFRPFVDEAHLALNDGKMFGLGEEGFMRLNVGTSHSVLKQALQQLADTVRRKVI